MNAKTSDLGGAWREHSTAQRWLGRTDRLPRWAEADAVVLTDVIGARAGRMLDPGTGDGYMLETLRIVGRCADGIGVDFSQPLLEAAARRFADDHTVGLIEHDLVHPLPQADRPAPLEPQLEWLRAAGFSNVDCYWKWLELAVIAGERSPRS
jgi:hypothetical protein